MSTQQGIYVAKQIKVDDQAIQTILLGLPEDIYADVDSCETAQKIWLRVQQIIEGSDIGIQEKKAKTQDPLALMATSNNSYTFLVLYQDQPSLNQNYMQQPMPNLEDIIDPTTAINMELTLMAKAFKLNYSTPTNNNQRISSNLRNRQIAQPGNLNGYNDVQNVENQNLNGNGNLVAARAEGNATGQNDLNEIEEVNANCILMANLQQASTSGTQSDKAPVYYLDGSAEVHNYEDCYDKEIFYMFTQDEQYTELLKPIPEPHQVPQNDNNVISKVSSVEQSGETIEQHPTNVKETRVFYDSLYNNLAIEVEKVNTFNRKLSETNVELTTELARYKNQERCFEIKKKKLKTDFKIREDELLDKQIQLEKRVKELDNILLKTGQSIQTIHMLSPKPDSFYNTEQKMALGYQNPFYLKQTQQKQQKAAKFVGDFKSLAKQADESLAKHKALELEIKRILRAVVSQDIMTVVQNNSVVDTSNLQTELERTKERFVNDIIKKENEYAKLWNDWSKKYEECKFDKISYDKVYNDMQQKLERLQA
nr:hypothetical protein [Tanacetum cinerariifolium]